MQYYLSMQSDEFSPFANLFCTGYTRVNDARPGNICRIIANRRLTFSGPLQSS